MLSGNQTSEWSSYLEDGALAKIGDSFGKAGTLVENPDTKVDWLKVSNHGLQRMGECGVTQSMVESWVKNGKV